MQDRLVVNGRVIALWAIPEPLGALDARVTQIEFHVETEEQLREAVEALGGIEAFGTGSGQLIGAHGLRSEGDRGVVAYVWLGEDLRPQEPPPPSAVLKLRAEAAAREHAEAERQQREADGEIVGPHDLTAGEVRSWEDEEPVLP